MKLKPDDPFPRYGVAMELVSLGSLEDAAAEFQELNRRFPDYTAAWYHHGVALGRLGRRDEARRVFEAGIEACRRKGDDHTLSELQAALEGLG